MIWLGGIANFTLIGDAKELPEIASTIEKLPAIYALMFGTDLPSTRAKDFLVYRY